jgi:lipopolysaccharide biosynthesis glycosyltransferase
MSDNLETNGWQLTIHVAAACDEGYAMPLAVLVASICRANSSNRQVVIHVVHPGISQKLRCKVELSLHSHNVSIDWIAIPRGRLAEFAGSLASFHHVSIAAYYHLLLPELLPDALEKVLYLDCDLVVIEDLSELWDTPLEGTLLGAVPEIAKRASTAGAPEGIRRPADLGLADTQQLFNSGVMLIDLSRWRAKLIPHRCFAYIHAAMPQLRWHDQEALNVVACGDWRPLATRWNVTMHVFGDVTDPTLASELVENPAIIHYNTSRKPWMAGFNMGFLSEFERHLDPTDWSKIGPYNQSTMEKISAAMVRKLAKLRRRRDYTVACTIASIRRLSGRLRRNLRFSKPRSPEIRLFVLGSGDNHLAFIRKKAISCGIDRFFLVDDRTGSKDASLRQQLDSHGRGHWCLVMFNDAPWSRVDWVLLRDTLQQKGCDAILTVTETNSSNLCRVPGYSWDPYWHRVVMGPVLLDPTARPELVTPASRTGFFLLRTDAAIGADGVTIEGARVDNGFLDVNLQQSLA